MKWTVDTLSPDPEAIQLIPENMLVFSPNNIWLVCYSDVARRLLWHFNGTSWSWVESGGGKRYTDLAGYNDYDIWLGGYSGDHPHFTHKNGNNFIRYDFDIKGQILDMTMDSQRNIWACGIEGLIMKYDKSQWIFDKVNVNRDLRASYATTSISAWQNDKYILAAKLEYYIGQEVYYFIKGDLKNWIIVDSMIINSANSTIKWGNKRLFVDKTGELYSAGIVGLWEYNNKKWENTLSTRGTLYDVYGVDKNYVLAVGDFAKIFFNNKNGWQDINYLFNQYDDNVNYKSVWTNGEEIFIAGFGVFNGRQKTIIWHGK